MTRVNYRWAIINPENMWLMSCYQIECESEQYSSSTVVEKTDYLFIHFFKEHILLE